jgi:hypothetical protein
MSENLTFRLGKFLRKEYYNYGENWLALSRAIKKTPGNERTEVDRRKLKALSSIDDPKVSLSIGELRAIINFLEHETNVGLDRLFLFEKSASLWDVIAESEEVIFCVAQRAEQETIPLVSLFDLRTVGAIVSRLKIGKKIQICDVSSSSTSEIPNRYAGKSRAIISIGSSSSSPETERILSDMLKGPSDQQETNKRTRSPFYFIFPDKPNFKSSFFLSIDEAELLIPEMKKDLQILNEDNTRAILLLNENAKVTDEPEYGLFISKRDGRVSYPNYGLVVAARLPPDGVVAICLMGTFGPATLCMAQSLSEIKLTLPPYDSSKPLLVLISLVKTEAVGQVNQNPNSVNWTDPQIMGIPRLYNVANGKWIPK